MHPGRVPTRTPPLARAPPPRDALGFRFKILFFLLRFSPPRPLPPRIESDPGPGVPDAERTAGGAVSGTGRAESWVAGAENRGSRPADSRARSVQCSIRSAPHPQEVPEVLGRPEGAVSGAGGGGSVFPPGLKSAAVALGQRLCWGDRPSCAEAAPGDRLCCANSLRPFPAYPARYWAPLGSRAGPPSAQSWGPGSGRLAGRFCSHFWACFSGRTHHFYIQVNWWRRKWQPTPVFLPGESCGRRSLVGCCPWGRTESDTTEET